MEGGIVALVALFTVGLLTVYSLWSTWSESARCPACGYKRSLASKELDAQQRHLLPLSALRCPACGWIEPIALPPGEEEFWLL